MNIQICKTTFKEHIPVVQNSLFNQGLESLGFTTVIITVKSPVQIHLYRYKIYLDKHAYTNVDAVKMKIVLISAMHVEQFNFSFKI